MWTIEQIAALQAEQGSFTAEEIQGYTIEAAIAKKLDVNMVFRLVEWESNKWKWKLVSRVLVRGKWYIIVGPAQINIGTAENPWMDVRTIVHPRDNIRKGVEILASHYAHFNEDWRKAMAAYNGGRERITQSIVKMGDNWEQDIPAETRLYLAQIYDVVMSRVIGTEAQAHIIPFVDVDKPGAPSLYAALAKHGAIPQSREFDVQTAGNVYRVLVGRRVGKWLESGQVLAFCRVGDWGNVTVFARGE